MLQCNPAFYIKAFLSIIGTYAVLGSGLNSLWQTGLFLTIWAIALFPLSRKEWIAFVLFNLNFIVMDIQAFEKGFFYFAKPDWQGLPYWELFAWGYFAVLVMRLFPFSGRTPWRAVPFAMMFSLCFSLFRDQHLVIITSFAALTLMTIMLGVRTLPVIGFSAIYGTIFETIGTRTGQWSYPEPNAVLGFPLWGISMWVGTGMIIAYIVSPLLSLLLGLNFRGRYRK